MNRFHAFALALSLCLCMAANAAPRQVVLLEQFTNTGSGACALVNPSIRTTLNAMTRDTVIRINYHTWWPSDTDPFYVANTTDVGARTTYYNVGSVPDVFVDYLQQPAPSNMTQIRNAVRARYATPSPCTLQLSAAVGSPSTSIHFVATVTAEEDLIGGSYRLYTALITDQFVYLSAPDSSGETLFPEPFRDLYPNGSSGQGFSIAAGESFALDGNLARLTTWPAADLTVIAFVQNAVTREILQAEWTDVITAPGSITLTSPIGGEWWYSGETQNITWNSTGITDNVRIELQRVPAGSWETLAADTENDGVFEWLINGPGTESARIRVTGATQTVIGDTSGAVFRIAGLTVTSPVAGDTLRDGYFTGIHWNSTALNEPLLIQFNRSYPSAAWETIYASMPDTGYAPWLVRTSPGDALRLRIIGTVHSLTGDTTDGDLPLVYPRLDITSPNGGETLFVGGQHDITWTSAFGTDSVGISIMRDYPAGVWETISAGTDNDGHYPWTVTAPVTASARLRLRLLESFDFNADISDGSFDIELVNLQPVIYHNPQPDFAPVGGSLWARVVDPSPLLSIASVQIFFRRPDAAYFDSLELSRVIADQYAVGLTPFSEGRWEYYLRATDNQGVTSTVPALAPEEYYTFDVGNAYGATTAFDDGTAESYNWTMNSDGYSFLWAVRFTPPSIPYALHGAQIAVARALPDTLHSSIYVAVLAADGPGGLPGSILYETVTGSIGNEPAGIGFAWVQVLFNQAEVDALVINHPEYFIAVGNVEFGNYEAFGRDTHSPFNHRSYHYDVCREEWFSEDDQEMNPNARPGDRMIRAQGFPLSPPTRLTLARVGVNDVELRWNATGAPVYKIYSSTTAEGPFDTLIATVGINRYVHTGAAADAATRFYQVVSASH